MPRKDLIRTADFPYHITNRSNNKEFFYVAPEDLWPTSLKVLGKVRDLFECQIHCFVLMSNHFHLIVSTPKENIGDAMKYFHREVARLANKSAGRVNHFFGGRYKWSVIHNEIYFWNAVKYVFRNPVEAGICARVEDFKYSSLNASPENFDWELVDVFNDRSLPIRLDLELLNESFKEEQRIAISKALRRRVFELPVDRSGYSIKLDAIRRKKGTVT
jgi:REP element-mobilizing transposase RayT